MGKSYNDLMNKDTGNGIYYEFPPISPVKHNALIMEAINLFGETGLYMLIGKIESAGNDILQTTWFLQSMQKLCRIDPMKLAEFQLKLLGFVTRVDMNIPEDKPVRLTESKIAELAEFQIIPGLTNKTDGIRLLNNLTVAALEEYVIPFVSMLGESDTIKTLIRSLTTWLKGTGQTSTGSSGDQSTQESSPEEAIDKIQKKRASFFGTSSKRKKS